MFYISLNNKFTGKEFAVLPEAQAYIKAEAKAKAEELEAAGQSFDAVHGYASESICTMYLERWSWEVRTSKGKSGMVPALFEYDKYVEEVYGLAIKEPTLIPVGSQLPYHGICFARKVWDKELESFWKKDADKTPEESFAMALIKDPKVTVGTRPLLIDQDGEVKHGVAYYLPLHNPESSIFKPTVQAPVSDAVNVDTEFSLELLFAFEDGYVVPIVKEFKTGGYGAISVMDAMMDIIHALDGSMDEAIDLIFEGSGSYLEKDDGDGFILSAATADGLYADMEFDFSYQTLHDLKRALTSIRLVELHQAIQ